MTVCCSDVGLPPEVLSARLDQICARVSALEAAQCIQNQNEEEVKCFVPSDDSQLLLQTLQRDFMTSLDAAEARMNERVSALQRTIRAHGDAGQSQIDEKLSVLHRTVPSVTTDVAAEISEELHEHLRNQHTTHFDTVGAEPVSLRECLTEMNEARQVNVDASEPEGGNVTGRQTSGEQYVVDECPEEILENQATPKSEWMANQAPIVGGSTVFRKSVGTYKRISQFLRPMDPKEGRRQIALAHRRGLAAAPYRDKSVEELHNAMNDLIDTKARNDKHSALQRSVWEVVLVVAHNRKSKHGMRPAETFVALFLLALNAFLQTVISILLELKVSKYNVHRAEAQTWRENVGHWDKTASSDGVAMVSRLCNGDKSLEQSGAQQLAISYAEDYLDELLFGTPTGVILCTWCSLVFFLLIWNELQMASDRLLTILTLPRSSSTRFYPVDPGDGPAFILHSMSRSRMIFSSTLCFVRVGVACVICHAGTLWLFHTQDVMELLTNSVALVFILDLDNVLYQVACPLALRALIEGIEPLSCPLAGGLHNPTRAVGTVLACAGFLCAFGAAVLKPTWNEIRYLQDLYCGGNTQFIVGVNSETGIVSSYVGKPASKNTEKSLMAAVTGELMHGQASSKAVKSMTWTNFQTYVRMSLAESVDTYGVCRDVNFTGTSFLSETLKYSLNDTNLSTCSVLTIHQCTLAQPIIRLACPERCGCGETRSGFFDLRGCPLSKCTASPKYQTQIANMRTHDTDVDVLSRLPSWNLYWKTYEEYIDRHPNHGNLAWKPRFIKEKFSSLGCEALRFFRTNGSGTVDAVEDFFCRENVNLGHISYRPLRPFCPASCKCATSRATDVFCPRPTAATTILCPGLRVKGAEPRGGTQCKQILANASSPKGWYTCIPSGYNGKNLYYLIDKSGVLWEIKWETAKNLDWGAHYLGSKIGLGGEPQWTLTSVYRHPIAMELRPTAARFFALNSSRVPPAQSWFPRNASTTDFDCVAGSMTTEGASKYWVGPQQTTTCKTGYIRINTSAACELAASAMGVQWWGVESKALYPKDCYVYRYRNPPSIRLEVWFNSHQNGSSEDWSFPLCQSTA